LNTFLKNISRVENIKAKKILTKIITSEIKKQQKIGDMMEFELFDN